MASTSLADSEASFTRQANMLGLHEDWTEGLINVGINTLGKLAFAIGQPGQVVEDAAVRDLLNSTHVARVITVGDVAVVKRLTFEAQTAVIAIIRSQSDPNSDPSQRKLPVVERNARLAEQRRRLVGMSLEGPLEVAHSVYDIVSGMLESDSLKYLHPSKCITRAMEISSQKPPKELKLDSSGTGIVVKEAAAQQECSVQGELDLMEALTRRSLAFDAVGLVKFEVFNSWINWMFQTIRQQPPPNFQKATLTQLLRADRQAFVRLQELSRDGIKPDPTGTRPLDRLIENLTGDHTVTFHLLPTAHPVKVQGDSSKKSDDKKGSYNDYSKWGGHKANKQWKKKQTWSKGGNKNGGKLPEALRGCASSTPQGDRICFAYNINGCNKCKPGESCDRGKHVCANKGCFQNHSKTECKGA